MRKEFKMTDEQLERIMEASKPVPYMVFNGIAPTSPQENANRVWALLSEEMGFDWNTVQPVSGKDHTYFTAECSR